MSNQFEYRMSNQINVSSTRSTQPVQLEVPRSLKVQNSTHFITVNGAIVTGDWEIHSFGTERKIKALEDKIVQMSQNDRVARNAEDDESDMFAALDRQFYSFNPIATNISEKLDYTRRAEIDVISFENDEE